ncbi:MAG: DUF6261 family protein [Tannerella sp.]|jgi:hypothetical protein|nr:DUF6261 family protein [Tannerella sp.]
MNRNIISRFAYTNLRNEAHVEFHETSDVVIIKYDPSTLGVSTQYQIYKQLLTAEISVLDVIHKSEYTKEIEDQNQVRGRTFRGLSDTAKSGLYHFNEDKRRASQKVDVVLGHYGNITAKTFDEKTAAIDDLLRELEESCPGEIMILNLNEWMDQLRQENQRFKELMAERYAEAAQRPIIRMKDARAAVDKAFRELLNHVEASIVINGLTGYEAFVHEMNAISERYKALLARSAGRRKKGDESKNEDN